MPCESCEVTPQTVRLQAKVRNSKPASRLPIDICHPPHYHRARSTHLERINLSHANVSQWKNYSVETRSKNDGAPFHDSRAVQLCSNSIAKKCQTSDLELRTPECRVRSSLMANTSHWRQCKVQGTPACLCSSAITITPARAGSARPAINTKTCCSQLDHSLCSAALICALCARCLFHEEP